MADEHTTALALPDEATFRREVATINRFQQVVHSCMIEGQDFGVIPGTQKPTLLKPGAEKITKLLGLADTYEIVDSREDWDKPFFHYLVRAILTNASNGILVSSGLGECNSMEARYRWRWVGERDLPPGIDKAVLVTQERVGKNGGHWTVYRVENEDIFSQVNTILKMAKKRALVDAALSAGRLSDIFTQDIEDIPSLAKDAVIDGEIVQPDKSSHWCTEHGVAFFKKGKMKGYAHPIDGTREWCNEEDVDMRGEFEKEGRDLVEEVMKKTAPVKTKEPAPEAAESVLHPGAVDTDTVTPTETEAQPEEPDKRFQFEKEGRDPPAATSPIDLVWLKEQLGILQGHKIEAWTNSAVVGKLAGITGRKAANVSEAVSYLSAEQAELFIKRINDTIAVL
uniref:Uncharacterized protein n=1 Tax=viral metagenome TaxID=1070528 RepID=A0A6M3LEV4_9ZZZZ